MSKCLWRLALVAAIAGCAEGGGGGQPPSPSPPKASEAAEIPANLTADLAGEDRDFSEAYARMPWVHANLVAGDWRQAQADLDFVRQRLADLVADPDVSEPLKARLERLEPAIATLEGQIRAEAPAAIQTATRLVHAFTALANDPLVVAWIRSAQGGGGGPVERAP